MRKEGVIRELYHGHILAKLAFLPIVHNSNRPCEKLMRGSIGSSGEPIFAIFFASRGCRPPAGLTR
jgi:hypothetical protein